MIPVILSGGSGTRLWPVSRAQYPKQFCQIFDESLQVMTLKRAAYLGIPWIVTNAKLRTHTEKSVRDSGLNGVQNYYEPVGRNTAPAVALVCRLLELQGRQDEVVAILPADHLIQNTEAFKTAMGLAETVAREGRVVTLGLTPAYAATGYGYIQVSGHKAVADVVRFHEKPSRALADEFVQSKTYFWNAGIFIFKAATMIAHFSRLQPEMWASFNKLQPNLENLESVYGELKSISIDYAIIEKLTSELACVPCDLGWSDVGSWDAVAEHAPTTAKANVCEVEAKNNFVKAQKDKIYALVGVDDLIVVDTADALLVTRKQHSEAVKAVVEKLQERQPKVAREHVFEERPWGQFEILRDESHFKSKVISVSPGEQLSYQSHKSREEHWVIVKGQGQIVLNDELIEARAGSYVKIPLGSRHRIRNTGTETLQFIEVQLGAYFGEDDIVRYQDDYNRL